MSTSAVLTLASERRLTVVPLYMMIIMRDGKHGGARLWLTHRVSGAMPRDKGDQWYVDVMESVEDIRSAIALLTEYAGADAIEVHKFDGT